MTQQPYDVLLDLKGLTCPTPLLGAKRMLDTLDPGQVLLLLSDCQGTHDDLISWTRQTGNQLVHKESPWDGGGAGYFVRKGRGDPIPAQATLDTRGALCPGPIVEAKRLLNGMQPGEVLKLLSNCPGIQSDIGGWAEATHLSLLGTIETAPGEFEFFIRRN